MVDSNENENSEIYGNIAYERRNESEQKNQIRLERLNNISHRNSSLIKNGDFIKPDTIPSTVLTNDISFQSKCKINTGLTFDETYNRIFIRRLGYPIKESRTQNLRNNDLNNKNYNLISHTLIEHWPAKNMDRLEDNAMKHPSQNSLENIRSLQGTSTERQNYY